MIFNDANDFKLSIFFLIKKYTVQFLSTFFCNIYPPLWNCTFFFSEAILEMSIEYSPTSNQVLSKQLITGGERHMINYLWEEDKLKRCTHVIQHQSTTTSFKWDMNYDGDGKLASLSKNGVNSYLNYDQNDRFNHVLIFLYIIAFNFYFLYCKCK